jgi:hypothetical protein
MPKLQQIIYYFLFKVATKISAAIRALTATAVIALTATAVSARVNQTRNDDPACLAPVTFLDDNATSEDGTPQLTLGF